MAFGNIFFLFAFLPISLILYYITPKKLKSATLVLVSLVFYAWGNPQYLVLMVFSILFNYITGIEIDHFQQAEKTVAARVMMIIAVGINLLLLGFFKYYGFLITNINAITGLHIPYTQLPLPLGISFFTFTVLSYVFDVYYMRASVQKNLLTFACYVTFYPKLISGPIVQYKDMEQQLAERSMAPAKFGAGINMFIVGLAKKVIIADNIGSAFSAISSMTTMSAATAWMGIIFFGLQLYFDFSGYSDMAIGLAKLFGFNFDKNFDYPFLSSSVSEYWRRWHISLASWFRDYLYIPLGGNRCSTAKNIRNIVIVWFLTGLWHGASWTYICWGLYQGAFILLEKFVLKDIMKKIPKPLGIFLTLFVIFFAWPLFFSPSLGSAMHYYGQMFGLGHLGFLDSTAKYYLSSNIILTIIAIIGSGPMVQRIHQNLTYRKGGKIIYVSIAGFLVLLMICVAYIMTSTYSTFLYAQF